MKTKLAVLLMLTAAFAAAQDSDVLVKVNSKPILRKDVAERIWALHASDALNGMVDEALVEQSLADFEAKASKKQKEGWEKEAAQRLDRVKAQFKDEAAFEENLKRANVTIASLRRQIEGQVMREQLVIAAKHVRVTPDEAREFFEANKEKLASPPAVHLRHILLASEQQGRDALIAVRVGADFSKLAKELSQDAASRDNGGDLGFVSRGMLMAELEKAAFALKPGEVSDLIHTPLGFHLLKVEEIREAKPAVFKEIEPQLTQTLRSQKIGQAWSAYVKELRAAAKIETSPGVTMSGPASR